MHTIETILKDIPLTSLIGRTDKPVNGIHMDSRKVQHGDIFVAIKGTVVDGHDYIDKAIENGAGIVVCEFMPKSIVNNVCYVLVGSTAEVLGMLSGNFFKHPSRELKLVGITGTNGKTTTATLLYDLFTNMGFKVGLLSTVENRIAGEVITATHTTPDAISLNALLSKMVTAGCEYVFMEVSSHAIHQRRIEGLQFSGGIFTNISHDHLDYHETFKAYIDAKKLFFDKDLSKDAFALTNLDDKRGTVMLQNTKAKKVSYSIQRIADYKARIVENSISGLQLEIDGIEYHSRLIGEFNAYNTLAVYATACLLGADQKEVLRVLSNLKTAEGRFDYTHAIQSDIMGIVDYAHTPDALEKVLQTILKLKRINSKLITVVGCGGDRDKTKRPIMAERASMLSDQLILTSDNPRSENPDTIIEEMQAGIPANIAHKVLSISDRKQAIKTACALANTGDIILVAGKGHEKYQEINKVKHPFDDKQILKEFLNLKTKLN